MAKYMFFDYIVVMVTDVAKPELFFDLDTVSGFSAPFTVSNELYSYYYCSVELHYHHIQKRQRKEKDEDKLKTLKKYKYVMFPAKNGMDCTTIYNPPFVEY